MNGMMLSMVSIPITPGERPAPDSPCMEVMTTRCSPKRSNSGFRVMTSPMMVQFGCVTMKPCQPRLDRCRGIRSAWSRLTPGISSGTSGSRRNAEAVLTTGVVAA